MGQILDICPRARRLVSLDPEKMLPRTGERFDSSYLIKDLLIMKFSRMEQIVMTVARISYKCTAVPHHCRQYRMRVLAKLYGLYVAWTACHLTLNGCPPTESHANVLRDM